MAQRPELGVVRSFILALHRSDKGLNIGVMFRCFSRAIGSELDGPCSSQNMSQHSNGILASQVLLYSLCPVQALCLSLNERIADIAEAKTLSLTTPSFFLKSSYSLHLHASFHFLLYFYTHMDPQLHVFIYALSRKWDCALCTCVMHIYIYKYISF